MGVEGGVSMAGKMFAASQKPRPLEAPDGGYSKVRHFFRVIGKGAVADDRALLVGVKVEDRSEIDIEPEIAEVAPHGAMQLFDLIGGAIGAELTGRRERRNILWKTGDPAPLLVDRYEEGHASGVFSQCGEVSDKFFRLFSVFDIPGKENNPAR